MCVCVCDIYVYRYIGKIKLFFASMQEGSNPSHINTLNILVSQNGDCSMYASV